MSDQNNENEAAAMGTAPQPEPETDAPAEAQAEPDPFAVLTALQAENAELKDKLLRAVAEAENVRRRAEREKQDAARYGAASFARDMVQVSDNLRRAIAALKPEERDAAPATVKALIEGVEMTERQLLSTFERHGIKEITRRRATASTPICTRRCSRCRARASRPARSFMSSRPAIRSATGSCAQPASASPRPRTRAESQRQWRPCGHQGLILQSDRDR